jgi:mRNA interferase RelE/StbE
MIYKLKFHPKAFKEWKKLSQDIKQQFKKVLKIRLQQPHVQSAKLTASLKNCYKIKLRSIGYRLIYQVNDNEICIVIIAVGRRDNELVYKQAEYRKLN